MLAKCKNAVDPSFGEDQHWGAENAEEPENAVQPSKYCRFAYFVIFNCRESIII